jgi:hypothetical protein
LISGGKGYREAAGAGVKQGLAYALRAVVKTWLTNNYAKGCVKISIAVFRRGGTVGTGG